MEIITSRHNQAVKKVRELKKRAARDMFGLAFVEGNRLVQEALASHMDRSGVEGKADIDGQGSANPNLKRVAIQGIYVSETYYRGGRFGEIESAARTGDIRIYALADNVFSTISDTEHPQGLLAVVDIVDYDLPELVCQGRGRNKILMIDRVADPGNAGAMIRTASAAAFSGVVLSKGCVDIYEPKTLRAAMGESLKIPIIRGADLQDTIRKLHDLGFHIYASGAFARQGAGDNADGVNAKGAVDYTGGVNAAGARDCFNCEISGGDVAIVIGSEANGIDPQVLAMCDGALAIPMPGGAESLNAGVAAGILIYELYRREQLLTTTETLE